MSFKVRNLVIVGILYIAQAYGDGGPQAPVSQAIAIIKSSSGSAVKGVVVFTKVQEGVQVVADVDGLKPGLHGFHIHEKGDCSASDASSAGGHYNPTNEVHGAPDALHRHIGDLGNIEADASGHGHYDRIDKFIALEGANSIIGKSIIVHEKEDDFKTQPTGNAGGRIGCGLIQTK